jgi:hypothetical protein
MVGPSGFALQLICCGASAARSKFYNSLRDLLIEILNLGGWQAGR